MVSAVGLDRYGFLERPFFQGVILNKTKKKTINIYSLLAATVKISYTCLLYTSDAADE